MGRSNECIDLFYISYFKVVAQGIWKNNQLIFSVRMLFLDLKYISPIRKGNKSSLEDM